MFAETEKIICNQFIVEMIVTKNCHYWKQLKGVKIEGLPGELIFLFQLFQCVAY